MFKEGLTYDNFAVGRAFDVLVEDDFPKAVGDDESAGGVFDTLDGAADVGVDGGVFEGAVGLFVEGAIFEHEVMGVTERLLAADVAVDQPQVLGVPS